MESEEQNVKGQAPSSTESSSPKPRTIFLHVLSPSSEVPKKLTFPSIPVATTIGELKSRIQDAIATRPAPGKQRLIYRGKALVRDTDTMIEVFGQDAVRQQPLDVSQSSLTP